MMQADAACSFDFSSYYKWFDSTSYHYFKYEPIKWRVLKRSGDTALILADKVLDAKLFSSEIASGWWSTSEMRSWLNGYGGLTIY